MREAVANALMHRDYSPDGCASQVQVTMYDDRIEILSPGGLCRAMTVDRLGETGVSFPRNQTLANILRATSYAEGFAEVGSVVENKGTGYFQIRASLREVNMPEPVAIDHITAFEVALYKAGAGAEAGRFGFGSRRARGGGGRGGVRLPEGAAGGKIVRSVTEWSRRNRSLPYHSCAGAGYGGVRHRRLLGRGARTGELADSYARVGQVEGDD